MGHISDLGNATTMEQDANRTMFDNYKQAKGKHSFTTFLKNLEKFYEFTLDAYVNGCYEEEGPQSREEAYELWVKYIKSPKEAERYFRAVDDFSAYS